MDAALMRQRVTEARVARLATLTRDGTPHIVVCCFALAADRVYTAVDDAKPKSGGALRRLENIGAHPRVSLLADHYEEDWSALWWVRLDGSAHIAAGSSAEHDEGVRLLVAKYEQYRRQPPPGPVIVVQIETWRAWP